MHTLNPSQFHNGMVISEGVLESRIGSTVDFQWNSPFKKYDVNRGQSSAMEMNFMGVNLGNGFYVNTNSVETHVGSIDTENNLFLTKSNKQIVSVQHG